MRPRVEKGQRIERRIFLDSEIPAVVVPYPMVEVHQFLAMDPLIYLFDETIEFDCEVRFKIGQLPQFLEQRQADLVVVLVASLLDQVNDGLVRGIVGDSGCYPRDSQEAQQHRQMSGQVVRFHKEEPSILESSSRSSALRQPETARFQYSLIALEFLFERTRHMSARLD